MNGNFRKVVATDATGVVSAAAEAIVSTAEACVRKNGRFRIALSGGSTPHNAYALMAKEPLIKRMPWSETEFYFGDERHVRPDHPDSNYRMAYEAMFHAVSHIAPNVFPILTADPDVEKCAAAYETLLHANFNQVPFPVFDLILLGIGPDGHTASLFPGTNAPKERTKWVTCSDPVSVNPAAKPPVKRITITVPVIHNATNVFVLANGVEKKPVLNGVFSESEPKNPPVARLLRECHGHVTFFVDSAAVL